MTEGTLPRPPVLFDEHPYRAEFGATLKLAWPLVLTQLAQVAINTTDVLIVGKLGAEPLAATALATGSFFILFLFAMGLATAVSPLVAQARGARQYRKIRRSVRQGLWASMTVGVPFMLVLAYLEPLALMAGQDPGVAARASDFMDIFLWCLPAHLVVIIFRNFFAAMDRPRPALYAVIGGIILNAALVWVLTFGLFGLPEMGLEGAALGSTITSYALAGILISVALIDRKLRRFHVLARIWRPDWRLYREIWRVGTPIGLAYTFEAGFFTLALYLMGLISTEAQAAHTIAIQLASIAFMVPMGISMAATVRVGIAVGRGDHAHVPRAGAAAYILGMSAVAFTALLFWSVPEPLVALFLDPSRPDSPRVAELAINFLLVAALFQLADGAQVLAMGCLRGLKDTRIPMLIAGFGYWVVGIALSISLGFWADLGGLGIWLGLAGGLAITGALLTYRFHRMANRF